MMARSKGGIIGSAAYRLLSGIRSVVRSWWTTSALERHMRQRKQIWEQIQADGYFPEHRYYPDWTSGFPPEVSPELLASRSDDDPLFAQIGQRVSLDPSMVVLDIGCGYGRLEEWLCTRVREVHGVDISREIVALAAERFRQVDNAFFHEGDGFTLSMFEDHSFELVLSYTVFQHIPRHATVNYLREIRRVLAPTGRVLVQFLGSEDDARDDVGTERKEYAVRYSQRQIVSLADDVGLRVGSICRDERGSGAFWLWAKLELPPEPD